MTSIYYVKSIDHFLKKAEQQQSFIEKIGAFFTKKRYASQKAKTFQTINEISFFERRKFSIAKKTIDKLYKKHINSLKEAAKTRKIRVAFLVTEVQKWHCDTLYKILLESKNFEPKIVVTNVTDNDNVNNYVATCDFFKKQGYHVIQAYDVAKNQYTNLKTFSPDIVFYQQPWNIAESQSIFEVSKFALTCYTPYCFHMLDSQYDYLERFHRFLWAYFVESEKHLESYKERFSAENCVASGSLHLDKYCSSKVTNDEIWNDKNHEKKRIIYAPHFTFNDSHMVATFHKNGKFILNLASMFPNTTWVIKPHPSFDEHVVQSGVMSQQELDEYYEEWDKYGTIYKSGDFFDIFKTSDCLITDCISFLADYLPTGNPVFHLRNDEQTAEFNDFAKNIINSYYQIHNNAELERLFSRVMIDNDDFMRTKRIEQVNALHLQNSDTASNRVFKYLKSAMDLS